MYLHYEIKKKLKILQGYFDMYCNSYSQILYIYIYTVIILACFIIEIVYFLKSIDMMLIIFTFLT